MSWLLFLDESGHDHKQMPYEVRGGVALHVGKLWPFVRAMQKLELDAFGAQLSLYRKELKGSTLLDKKRFKSADRRFVQRLEGYFTKTTIGRYRSHWMVPSPFFVASDMSYAVQAADLCIYCVNWGYRLPEQGMNAPARTEIERAFGAWLDRLQFRGEGYRDGRVFRTFGIVHVPDLFEARK